MTLARWARTARLASSGRRSATASRMARCSASETSGRPGRSASWNWCRTSWPCSRSSRPMATCWAEIAPTRRCSSRLSSEYLQRVAVGDRALEVLPELAQLRGLGVGDALGRLDRAERLQRHPALGDRHRLFGGDDADPRAAVGDPLDQPLGGEIEQRRPQRLPGDPERAREVLLDQPPAGGEIPAEDRLPDRGERVRPRGLPGLRATGRSCWHVPNATEPPRIVNNLPW